MDTTQTQTAVRPKLDMFTLHARRFTILSWLAIGVSYVHQADALLRFSGPSSLDIAAALGQTAIVDLALWMLGEYLYEARRAGRKAGWAQLAFLIAIIVSIGLNFVYLYTHRPPADVLDLDLSTLISAVFATFIPLLIGVSGLIRADLSRWREEAAGKAAEAWELRSQARQARAEATELARQLRDAQAAATAAHGSSTEQARQAHAAATEAHARATAAERLATERERLATEQARQLAEVQAQATALARQLRDAQAQATALPTRATVAERLRLAIDGGATVASLARETGWKESTLRDMVAAG